MPFFIVRPASPGSGRRLDIADSDPFPTRETADASARARYADDVYRIVEAATVSEALQRAASPPTRPDNPPGVISARLRAS